MRPTRVWVGVFVAGVLLVAAMLAVTLLTPAFQGDLTRMGMLSESDYGWREPQPVVAPKALVRSPLDQADVLVVGDSFSKELVWQSVLVASGLRVASVHWHALGDALCADIGPWLRARGFRGHTVLVQSVEREWRARLDRSLACQTQSSLVPPRAGMPGQSAVPLMQPSAPLRAAPPAFALNTREKFSTGVLTAYNTWRASRRDSLVLSDGLVSDRTRLEPVAQGCTLFSHRRCTHALFLSTDFERAPLSATAVAPMRKLDARLSGWHTLWLVVPNKRTLYLQAQGGDFFTALAQAGLGFDADKVLRQALGQGKDLYFPNDTHLSTRGYLILGAAVLRALSEGSIAR
jgi:hypothetical protein